MEPEWTDFKILVALGRAGSVAGAARELGVDGSTVSRRLSALEECLDTKLIVRGGRDFAWTSPGRAVLSAAEAMEVAVSDATRACREAKLQTTGAVRVSLAPAFVPLLLTKMMPALREKQPSLKLDVRGDLRKVDLAKGEADVVVRMIRPTEPGLVGRRALENGWCVFTSVQYAAARGMPTSIAELAAHHLVLYDQSLHGIEGLRWMEPHRGEDFLRVDNLELASQLIAMGSGVGVLPAFCEVTNPGLLRVFPDPVTTNTGWVVYHEAARDTARVRAAASALVEFFETNAAMFSGRR